MSTLAVWSSGPAFIVWFVRIALVGLLVAVCVTDLRGRRIPNLLVALGLAFSMVWQAFGPTGSGLFDSEQPGALGLGAALAGAIAAFAVFLVLHLTRTMGAGDVKLMAMLGAFFCLELLPQLVLCVFLMGGLLAALRMLNAERRRTVLANLQLILFERIATPAGTAGPRFDPATDTADRLPFALAISGGALLLATLCLTGVIA
jgi:prepilin peptidase CpaA